MDATQKQTTRKVAIIATVYFAITLLVIFGANIIGKAWWISVLAKYCSDLTEILHPQLLLFSFLKRGGLSVILGLISIPIWSICLAWLFVKFTHRLNNFPVLGRKVF